MNVKRAMTSDLNPQEFAEILKQLNDGEKTADQMEKMLDNIEAKIEELEKIQKQQEEPVPTAATITSQATNQKD